MGSFFSLPFIGQATLILYGSNFFLQVHIKKLNIPEQMGQIWNVYSVSQSQKQSPGKIQGCLRCSQTGILGILMTHSAADCTLQTLQYQENTGIHLGCLKCLNYGQHFKWNKPSIFWSFFFMQNMQIQEFNCKQLSIIHDRYWLGRSWPKHKKLELFIWSDYI